jgi:hypothetical protein
MVTEPGAILPIIATGDMSITDGQIVTDARFDGDNGEVGLVGRSAVETRTYYYCGVDIYGGANCMLFDGSQWYELFSVASDEIERYQTDRLALDIYGDTLTFFINGQVAGSYTDAAVAGGSWGLATVCYEGDCAGSFDYVDVYDYGTASNKASTATIIATDFTGDQGDSFYTGQGDWGSADINDGWYTVSLAPGLYFPNMIAGTDDVNDGTITADIAFDGEGSIGVIARLSYNEDGSANFYVCWVSSYAFANCRVVVNDEWYSLEGSKGVDVALEEINRLSLGVMGDEIFFTVNGQVVSDVSDATLPTGAMGFFHEAFSDSSNYFNTFVDAVNVEVIGGAASGAAISSDLDGNDLGLYTGIGEWGLADFVYDGFYTVEMAPGLYFANPITDTAFIDSGVMTTVAYFGGDGSTGLIARFQSGDAGDSFYVCWIDTDAYAGCNVVVDDEWYSLGYTDQPLALDEMSELSLAVYGSEITFTVDGVVIVDVVDDTLASGDWGFYNDAYSNGEGSWSDTDMLVIEQF